jgi:hypothetical protein
MSHVGKLEQKGHHLIAWPMALLERGAGWRFGAAGLYAFRPEGHRLSRVHVHMTANASTRGAKEYVAQVRLFDLLGHKEVFDVNLIYRDDPVFPYFGAPFPEYLTSEELEAHQYELWVRSVEPEVNYENSLWVVDAAPGARRGTGYLRGVLGWRMEVDHIEAHPDSIIAQQRPDALGHTRRGVFYTGIAWDSRDNDFHPHKGGLHDITIASAGPWAGSTSLWTRVNLALRFYRSLGTPRIVAASHFMVDHFVGTPPAMALAQYGGLLEVEGIGGNAVGRGYYRRRYGGPTKGYMSHELRFQPWSGKILRWEFEPGLRTFVDVGLTHNPGADKPTRIHPSMGFGWYFIWDDFAVVRVDLAVGVEGPALYIKNGNPF